jgi:pimeloyl-ACP methyl ester carboxylesterase
MDCGGPGGTSTCRRTRRWAQPVSADYLARITVPVLAIFAEVDLMVPPELNIPLLCAGLLRAGNADVTVHRP